jgi:GNAT superfamily N-acetyltransferase
MTAVNDAAPATADVRASGMTTPPVADHRVRRATPADAGAVAALLDAFNREFDTSTPGTKVLAGRLERLLAGDDMAAILSGDPAIGVALISFRPSVWYEGGVATLDELYVRPDLRNRRYGHAMLEAVCALVRERGAGSLEINVDGEDVDAQRFYERHGFSHTEPGNTEPMYYYYRDLD